MDHYTYANPTKNRRYVQVLQYVYDHPKCLLKKFFAYVFGKPHDPGSHSSLFARMIEDGLFEYDSKYRYTILPKGLDILKKSYINDCVKAIGY